jgi:hypothetical protein
MAKEIYMTPTLKVLTVILPHKPTLTWRRDPKIGGTILGIRPMLPPPTPCRKKTLQLKHCTFFFPHRCYRKGQRRKMSRYLLSSCFAQLRGLCYLIK